MNEDVTTTSTVALLAGSFDPPHVCHLLLSSYVRQVCAVDEVWWLPCSSHAFGKQSAPFEDRVALCERATRHRRDMRVCRVEAELPDPSYTIDTIAALRAQHPRTAFVWIAGSDLMGELDRWHRCPELLKSLPFIVVRRGETWVDPPPQGHFDVLPLQFPDLSSTQVREAIERDDDVGGLVDGSVLEEIRRRGLYRS